MILLATASFTKNFAITKKETVEKLENALKFIKPLNIDTENIITNMKINERKLLNFLRSKN